MDSNIIILQHINFAVVNKEVIRKYHVLLPISDTGKVLDTIGTYIPEEKSSLISYYRIDEVPRYACKLPPMGQANISMHFSGGIYPPS